MSNKISNKALLVNSFSLNDNQFKNEEESHKYAMDEVLKNIDSSQNK
jgi:hypothetical protein